MRHEHFPKNREVARGYDMTQSAPVTGLVNGLLASFVLWALIAGVVAFVL
ncbi:hypothetical protein [uncultured Sphingomonas sp.]|nr:hypothetical protein [uncultured Sphingomonas sp.]